MSGLAEEVIQALEAQWERVRGERNALQAKWAQARRSLTSIASCSTCEVCRGVANIALILLEVDPSVINRIEAHHCPRCGKGPFTFHAPMPKSVQRVIDATTVTRQEYPDLRADDVGPIADNE